MVDNCEHLIGGCAKIAEAIVRRCPRVHLLATSREPLGIGGESIYRVPSLSLPGPADSAAPAHGSSDAVALFAERARAHGVALDVDGQAGPLVVSVCRRLDGMPLAIELAAARLRSMSLAELGGRLDQRFRLLTGGSRTALERQQTLLATVAWSYSLLTGAERVLLGRLSVFAGGFGLDAAEAVCGSGELDVLDVADLLGSLVDKSLVVAEPAGTGLRYRLLETIRLFAAERLEQAGDLDDTRRHHAKYCAGLAERASEQLRSSGPAHLVALDQLEAEHGNLHAALTWSLETPAAGPAPADRERAATGLRLVQALALFWYRHGYLLEGKRWLQRAIDLTAEEGGAPLAQLAHWLGVLLQQQGEPQAALLLLERSLAIWRDLGERDQQARELNSLGITHHHLDDFDTARSLLEESAAISREVGSDMRLAAALTNLGQLEADAGNFDRATQVLQEALAIDRKQGDMLGVALDQQSLAGVSLRAGRAWEARDLLSSMAGYVASCGDPELLTTSLEMAAANAAQLGEALRAARLTGAADAIRQKTGIPIRQPEMLEEFLAPARATSVPEAWDAALAAGRALTQQQAATLLASPVPST